MADSIFCDLPFSQRGKKEKSLKAHPTKKFMSPLPRRRRRAGGSHPLDFPKEEMVKEEKSALSLSFPVMGGGLADFAKLLVFPPLSSYESRRRKDIEHRLPRRKKPFPSPVGLYEA